MHYGGVGADDELTLCLEEGRWGAMALPMADERTALT